MNVVSNHGMKKGTCFLVCAGERVPLQFTPCEGDFVIAVDGGAEYLDECGKSADLYLGDFDSLGCIPNGENVIELNPVKDETDLFAAAEEGLRRGYRVFRIYCALGGRTSHLIGNLHALCHLFRMGADAKIIGNRSELFFIRHIARFQKGGYLSLVPLDGGAAVLIENCKYSGEIHLTTADSLGVSNEPLEGACVTVLSGEVLAIVEETDRANESK